MSFHLLQRFKHVISVRRAAVRLLTVVLILLSAAVVQAASRTPVLHLRFALAYPFAGRYCRIKDTG